MTQPSTASLPPDKKPFEWKGNRVGLFEVGATGALALGFGAANLFMKDAPAKWKGGVLMDNAAASAFTATTPAGRDRASRISDYFLFGTMALPFIDAGIAAARNPDVGWQLAVIDTGAYALNGLLTTIVKRTVLRERPSVAHCAPGQQCQNSESFFSGHASAAFTAAGLVCAEHQALGIYGNKLADGAACATALAAAAATGMLRVVADKHYMTDVLTGAAVGLASGYLLPTLIHWSSKEPSASPSLATTGPKDKPKPPPPPKYGTVHLGVTPVPVMGGGMLMVNGVVW
ncbi:MAG: phosphatase PAP2 family protein [Polyangiales bacterium]